MASPFRNLVLVDCCAYIHRWWFAGTIHGGAPPNPSSSVPNLVKTMTNMVVPGDGGLVEVPNKVILCHEGDNAVRKAIFPEYKGHKVRADAHVAYVQQCCEEMQKFQHDSVLSLPTEEFHGEADDVIAYIVKNVETRPVVICSHDVDLFQLLEDQDSVKYWDLYSKKFINDADIEKRVGVRIEHIHGYKSLVGDPADNIIGIRGIGKKTGRKLMEKYGTLDRVLEEGPLQEAKATAKKLTDGKDDALMAEQLVKIPICDLSSNDKALLDKFLAK